MATGMQTEAKFRLTADNLTGPGFKATQDAIAKTERRTRELAGSATRAQKAMMGLGPQAAAFLGPAAIFAFAKSVISAGDEIGDLADKTGFGVESIQSLQIVAKDAGIRVDRLTGSINHLQGQMQEARVEGGEKLAESFAKLGVTSGMLASGDTEKVFEQIAKALRAGAGDATISAAAHDVLGSSVEKLGPILRAAADGMAKLNGEMKANGEIMSKQEVASMSRADRTLQRFGNKAKVAMAGGIENTGALIAGAKAFFTGGDRSGGLIGNTNETVQAAQGSYFSSLNGPRAELRARPFSEPMPSNFVEEASRASDEALVKQDEMISVLDKISSGIARLNQAAARNLGPIGP